MWNLKFGRCWLLLLQRTLRVADPRLSSRFTSSRQTARRLTAWWATVRNRYSRWPMWTAHLFIGDLTLQWPGGEPSNSRLTSVRVDARW